MLLCYGDGLGQLPVDAVAGILDGYGQTAPPLGDHRDGLAAVAAQGEQKAAELRIIGTNALNNIFFSCLGRG